MVNNLSLLLMMLREKLGFTYCKKKAKCSRHFRNFMPWLKGRQEESSSVFELTMVVKIHVK